MGGIGMKMQATIDKAIKAAGGLDAFKKQFNAYSANDEYFAQHRNELLESYDGKWVAIHDSKLLAVGDAWKDVMSKVKKRRIPDDEVVVRFLVKKPKVLIL
jgi:hypothetical protein